MGERQPTPPRPRRPRQTYMEGRPFRETACVKCLNRRELMTVFYGYVEGWFMRYECTVGYVVLGGKEGEEEGGRKRKTGRSE